jgi:hypothetical protein
MTTHVLLMQFSVLSCIDLCALFSIHNYAQVEIGQHSTSHLDRSSSPTRFKVTGGDVAWDKWHVFYVDERNVPHDSIDSNHRAARAAFLAKLPIPAPQVQCGVGGADGGQSVAV